MSGKESAEFLTGLALGVGVIAVVGLLLPIVVVVVGDAPLAPSVFFTLVGLLIGVPGLWQAHSLLAAASQAKEHA